MAQGYSQMKRVDYDETFSPVARMHDELLQFQRNNV